MRHLLRPVAALATGVLVASALTAGLAGPAHAAPEDDGADWLAGQLTDGLVFNETFGGFNDYGLTVDFGLAFDDIGRGAARNQVRDALADHVDDYTTGGPGEIFAGSTAKLAVFARTSGADPRGYGGVDLVQRLNRRVVRRGPMRGRIQDKSQFGDFSNTIGQAFAARALTEAGTGKARKAVHFLLNQQCRPGYFRLVFSPRVKKNQTCDASRGQNKAADTDATALAVLQLRGLPRADRTRETRRAAARAVNWMKRTQKRNGSHGGGVATEASNANSTGLAAWAMAEGGACGKARKAARWARGLQVSGDVTGTPLEGEAGAIAYDRAAMNAGQTDGITAEDRDQWRRTTAQAAPGLAALGC